MLKISFISTVFNEEKNIGKWLESIINQSKKPDEIIIVDGGSKDKTVEKINNIKKRTKITFIIKIIPGANIAKGRNEAIKLAKGNIIFVSDAGCVIDKNWIEDTLKYFKGADVVAGNYKAITKNNFEFFQSLIVLYKKGVTGPTRMSSRNIAFKKSVWKKVGGYPEDFLTGEDTLFNMKIINSKFKIKINPKRMVLWEMRPTLVKFFKQFYLYGKGDKKQGNLKNLKKNLILIFGFWMYLILILAFLTIYPLISLILLATPIAYSIIMGFFLGIKTKKLTSIYWVPILILTKRISYILGASLG